MSWIDLLIVVLAIPMLGLLIFWQWKREQAIEKMQARLREDAARLIELQYLQALSFQLEETPLLAENLVDSGTNVLQGLHKGVSRIPFSLMKSIPLVRDAGIIQTHDLISDAVYDGIRDINKLAAKTSYDALMFRRKQWEKLIGKQPRRRR